MLPRPVSIMRGKSAWVTAKRCNRLTSYIACWSRARFRESDGWPVITDIVDDDIQGQDRSSERGDPIGVSDVDVVRDHAVGGADLHHEVRVEFGDVDLGTVSDEQLGRRSSDSRSATGDDGGATRRAGSSRRFRGRRWG